MWLCICSGMRFEDSFENTQWRKAKSKAWNSRRHEDNYFQFLNECEGDQWCRSWLWWGGMWWWRWLQWGWPWCVMEMSKQEKLWHAPSLLTILSCFTHVVVKGWCTIYSSRKWKFFEYLAVVFIFMFSSWWGLLGESTQHCSDIDCSEI